MNVKHLFLSSTMLLVVAHTGLAADATAPATTAPVKPSAGLLNDWLREKNVTDSSWDIGVQTRVRLEGRIHNGVSGATDFRRNGVDNNLNLFLYRIRPHVGYNADWIGFMVEGRHSDTVGDKRPPMPEDDQFDLHQAYVRMGNVKEAPISLQIGRQELSYGDERLVGAFGWNNIGRVFDTARARYEGDKLKVDVFSGMLVVPNQNNFNRANQNDHFSGIYATTKLLPKNTLDLYFLARNAGQQSPATFTGAAITAPSPRDIYTPGIRLQSLPGEFGNWDYTMEFMGQFGHYNDPRIAAAAKRSLDHRAFACSVNMGHTWADNSWKPRLALEYNYASGDSNPNDGKHTTFENLFPTNHKFYGFMDTVSLQNIHDARLSASAKPHKKVNVTLDYHSFWLANTGDNYYTVAGAARGGTKATPGTGYGRNPNYSSYLGSEIDLVVSYNVYQGVNVELGAGRFLVGDYIRSTWSAGGRGAADGMWGYLQATFNF